MTDAAPTPSVSAASLAQALRASSGLAAPSHVDVADISGGCGASFRVVVVSHAFVGCSVVERHRLVHAAIGGAMQHVHALQLKCYTPEAYARVSQTKS